MSDIEHRKHAGGRPLKYDISHCDKVVEWGKQGKSKAWMAANLDVSRETLYAWEKTYPEFSDAITRAMTHSQAWWEDVGQSNLTTSGFAQSMWSRSMGARFPEDWRESTSQEITGKDGSPLVPVLNVNVRKSD